MYMKRQQQQFNQQNLHQMLLWSSMVSLKTMDYT